jgi:hypothetical protein
MFHVCSVDAHYLTLLVSFFYTMNVNMASSCYFAHQELLKSIISRGDDISTLDFSGIQQLTDDVFVALKKVAAKTRLRETVRRVYCTGCIHITDLGVGFLAQSLPSLQEVLGIFHLVLYKNIRILAT